MLGMEFTSAVGTPGSHIPLGTKGCLLRLDWSYRRPSLRSLFPWHWTLKFCALWLCCKTLGAIFRIFRLYILIYLPFFNYLIIFFFVCEWDIHNVHYLLATSTMISLYPLSEPSIQSCFLLLYYEWNYWGETVILLPFEAFRPTKPTILSSSPST